MPLANNITHFYEPTSLSCGQTVLAMLLGCTPQQICEQLNKYNELTLKEMFFALEKNGVKISNIKQTATKKEQLPQIALLSLKTPFCWHWSLHFNGKFLDPEYGVLNDFPPFEKCFFWKIDN